jgi:predicted negative regulator of RcsB-dependent stress response
VEIYSTEEQQVQAIKDWWKKNGTSVMVGLVLGLGGVLGWKQFNSYQINQKQAASAAYQATLQSYASTDDVEPAVLAQTIEQLSGSSHYKSLAKLTLAKELVGNQEYDAAAATLEAVVASAPEPVKSMAAIRLARVQGELKAFDKALATLSGVSNAAFASSVAAVRGDILLQSGNSQGARAAYQAAIVAGAGRGEANLQLKLDDLAELEAING